MGRGSAWQSARRYPHTRAVREERRNKERNRRPGGIRNQDSRERRQDQNDLASDRREVSFGRLSEPHRRIREGDVENVERLSKALEARIKSEAKDISDKYIDPPHTTDFAILFLPNEGLFAEALRRPGFVDNLRRDYKVVIAGPTTVTALLSSLQVGFRALAIEKRSSEVWAVLAAVKKEFVTFGDILDKTHKKLEEAASTIEKASSKSRTIERKLGKVQELPSESPAVLPMPSTEE